MASNVPRPKPKASSMRGRLRRFVTCDRLLLLGLVVFVLTANTIWSFLNRRPPHWDMARHLWISVGYYNLLQSHHVIGWLSSYWYYPPLVYWLTAPLYLIFGVHMQTAILVNVIFVTVLAYATYGLGKLLWDRRTGLLAAVFVLTLPMFVTQFKEFQLDAPLAAVVTLTLYLLVRCRNFSDRRMSWWLGVMIGLGMLTKWSFGFIMAAPLAYAAIMFARDLRRSKHRAELVTNFVGTALIAYAIFSLWYLTNLHQLRIDFSANGVQAGVLEGDPVIGSLASNLWYVRNLFVNQLYLIPALCFAVGLGFTIVKRRFSDRNLYPLLVIIGSIVVFTFLRNKDARYTLSILPCVSIVAVAWLGQLPKRWLKIATAAIVVYGLLTFLNISFGLPGLPKRDLSVRVPGVGAVSALAQHGYIIGPPSSEQWHQEDIFKLIQRQSGSNQSLRFDGLDTIWFNGWGMTYYAAAYHDNLVNTKAEYWVIRDAKQPAIPQDYTLDMTYHLPDQSWVAVFKHD